MDPTVELNGHFPLANSWASAFLCTRYTLQRSRDSFRQHLESFKLFVTYAGDRVWMYCKAPKFTQFNNCPIYAVIDYIIFPQTE